MEQGITRRGMLKAGVAAAAAGAVSVAPKAVRAGSAKFKWRAQTHWPTGVGYYKDVYVKFCDRVREASDGEIDITPLPPGAIVPTNSVFEAVSRGLFEIALIWPAYWIGKVPVAGHINGQLFTWENMQEMWAFFYDMGAIDIFRQAYAEHGLYFVAPQPVSGVTLFSKRSIQTIDDFKGFKVRSTGIPAQVFQKAGATPVFFPGEELYQALQTGVCEGAHWGSVAGGWSMKFQEVTNHIIQPNFANISNGEIFVNSKKWDELGADHKRIITDCAAASAVDLLTWFGYNDIMDLQEYREKKMGAVVTMNPETVNQLLKYSLEVVDEYSKQDPKYCGKAGDLLKQFLKATNRI